MGDLVQYEEDGHIAFMSLNAPESSNALSPEMLDDLASAIDQFEANDDMRVAILRGNGRGFCAGYNMSSKKGTYKKISHTPWEDRQRLYGYALAYLRIWDCSKPIITKLHGFCMAAGVQLAQCSDAIVISDDCRVGWPKLPTGGGWIGPMFSFSAGPHLAKQMSMAPGRELTGKRAAEVGWANFSVPAEEVDDAALELARDMARVPLSMLQLKKAAINRVYDRMGFRETVLAGVEWDVLAHKDPSTGALREWLQQDGMKATIKRFYAEGL